MPKISSLLLVVSISWLLLACSISPIDRSQENPGLLSTESPENWHASGRFSYADDKERQSGQFDWQQQGSNYQVRLFGPLGMGSVKIVGSADRVEIESGDQSYSSDQPDLLLYEMTGMNIPIRELSLWMTGAPGNDPNRNWQIAYDQYQNVGEYSLPTRIDIEKDLSSMRIAVAEWNLGDAE